VGSPAKIQTFALDEELWFGDHDDAEAEGRAAASLAAVGARIVGAKPFPVAARRLDELTRNPSTRIEQVVNVLESDPALSARLLRLVNSAGYGLKVRVTSVRHAAVLVGTRRLNQVATTAAILDLFDGNNAHGMELLEHAAVVGSLCRYLAVHQGLPHDELFTCGFLHDIGKLMLLDAERERYAELLNEFGHAPDQIHLAERKLFGFDHAVLGAHVLTAWNIPEPVPRVIAWHHAPARAMQDTVVSAMVQTLRLADLLAYVLALPDEQQAIGLAAASEAANYLEVSDVQLAAMWSDLSALRDRSRARSHGEPELDAMVPKVEVPAQKTRASLSPSQKPAKSTGRPLHEVPSHFPCSVCAKPSFGNVCAACGGHVCPSHQVGADEWCSVCAREFVRFKKSAELSSLARIGVAGLVGTTLAIALYSASRAPDAGIETLILAPVMVLALWAVVLPVAFRLWQKLAFLERRRKKNRRSEEMPVARPRTAHMPSAASVSALVAAPVFDAESSGTAASALDSSRDDDAPLSKAPLSTAPLSVPPVLSSPPRSLAPRPSVAAQPARSSIAQRHVEPDSVAPPPVFSSPEISMGPESSLVPESMLPDSDFISVRPTSVSVALAAHFGKSLNPSVNSTPPRARESMRSAPSDRPVSLVSERPRLTADALLDGLTLPKPEPVRIQEAEPPTPSVVPQTPPTLASVRVAAPVAPAEASTPASLPAPRISLGPEAVVSLPPEASVAPPAAVSMHPAPVASVHPAPVASVHPAPVASVHPAPVASVHPAREAAGELAQLPVVAAPAAAAEVAAPAAAVEAAAPAVEAAAQPMPAVIAVEERVSTHPEVQSSLPAPGISVGSPTVVSMPAEPSLSSDVSREPSDDTDTPDSGAQPVVQPPPPRVYNSPLVGGAAMACSRTPLRACAGTSGPKISYRPPAIATPGSRESA
jgi:putative nucleotidyltransferase with HDIG domain